MTKGCQDVLLIDDDEDIRAAMKEILELEGYCVHTAANGQEALLAVRKLARPCLVLLDLKMPVMSGQEFLQELRAIPAVTLAQLPVIVLTASRAPKPPGASGQMSKPIDLEKLLELVAHHCKAA